MTGLRCAAIYARVSTDKQSQLSTADQIRKCREYAAAHGMHILDEHIYVDHAVSGVGVDRAALARLLDVALSSGRAFDVVLTDDTSRLSRTTEDALTLFKRLNFAGVQLVAISQGIDSDDEQASVLVTVHGLVDSLYVKELAKKTHRGLEGLVLRGLHAGGRCYGYDSVPGPDGHGKTLIVNQAEAAVVRRIFEMSASGVSLKIIAKTFNQECLPPPRARRGRRATWCPTCIHAMLRRELYLGRVAWNRSRFVKTPGTNKRVRRVRPESEWCVMERAELRIVSNELWSRVRSRLEQLTRTYSANRHSGLLVRAASSPYLFSGVLKCGACGGNLVIVSGGKNRRPKYGCSQNFYRGACSNSLRERQDWIEVQLLSELQETVLRPEVVDYAVEEFGRQLKDALANLSGNLGRMRERRDTLEGELRRLAEGMAQTGPSPTLVAAIHVREQELREINEGLWSSGPESVESRVRDIRDFVTRSLADLRKLLATDVVLARAVLMKHVSAIRMIPLHDGAKPHYLAEGEWDLLGRQAPEMANRQAVKPADSVGCGGWI